MNPKNLNSVEGERTLFCQLTTNPREIRREATKRMFLEHSSMVPKPKSHPDKLRRKIVNIFCGHDELLAYSRRLSSLAWLHSCHDALTYLLFGRTIRRIS
ncbi:unnamed protein product [Acanthoscelides obtectus]|uniref:Uncharacterized protein n=1 Tax=Acanthoscelides obtectus TaxID=200917 RepID=A0A9P0LDR7_ACAOB|nr:unnamed protein product [Acanthoscelides obtectus]CAK1634061.1 hypothetical protein AOBTE_LOCUS8572 [Acanthoscelides obtectus]